MMSNSYLYATYQLNLVYYARCWKKSKPIIPYLSQYNIHITLLISFKNITFKFTMQKSLLYEKAFVKKNNQIKLTKNFKKLKTQQKEKIKRLIQTSYNISFYYFKFKKAFFSLTDVCF